MIRYLLVSGVYKNSESFVFLLNSVEVEYTTGLKSDNVSEGESVGVIK